MKGMLALALERMDDHPTAAKIMTSLKENAVRNDEMGMYWKELEKGGYYWYQQTNRNAGFDDRSI
ncbi:MAG: hypothetical protein IPN09_14270 [Bacteroidetes bacterium]|nr:hypothetical protein [Bacteroidota bacterium]